MLRAIEMALFEKGQPKGGGRVKGVKNKLSHVFLTDLLADYEAHGAEAIRICRLERPVEYIKMIAGLLPKEFEITDTRLQELSDEELDDFIAKLRGQLRSVVAGDIATREGETAH
jgi:hypothetical protein